MRSLSTVASLMSLLLAFGCHSEPAPRAPAEPAPPAAASAAPPVAAAAKTPPGDAASGSQGDGDGEGEGDGEGGDGADTSLYNTESFGPLQAKLSDKELIAILGKPRKRSAPQMEAATGAWATQWSWPDAEAVMTGDEKAGPWHARAVTVRGRSKYATKLGVRVGSPRADVERLYPRSPEGDRDDPDSYLAGSVYGGMLFKFKAGKVESITLGVFAF